MVNPINPNNNNLVSGSFDAGNIGNFLGRRVEVLGSKGQLNIEASINTLDATNSPSLQGRNYRKTSI